jgi:hypothetical protein
MSKKHQYKQAKDENGEELDPFYEVLEVLDTEYLIRIRRRLEKVGRKEMIQILSQEITERTAKEAREAKQASEAIKETINLTHAKKGGGQK